jgi:hypothetical protein
MDTNTSNSSSTIASAWLDPAASEMAPEVRTAIAKLAEAQTVLAVAIGEHVDQAPTTDSIEQLLNDAQRAANQIVERAELEALTIRRLMRIEAERLAANVERFKERAAALEH